MKLNKKDIIELRKTVEEEIKKADLPDGARIKINNDLLSQLLFEEYSTDNKADEIIKIPVWSGEFLRHIDLSEIDFSNVSWELANHNPAHLGRSAITYTSDVSSHKFTAFLDKYNCRDNEIDYSHTNACIDLNKSYEVKKHRMICLANCCFSGVTFKDINPDLAREIRVYYSDLSNSNLEVPKSVEIKAESSNLENLDLTGRTVVFNTHFKKDADSLGNCNLRNTGVNIILDPIKWNQASDREELLLRLKEGINNNWIGCYVNGKLMESPEDKANKRDEERKKYDAYKGRIKATTISDITSQVKKLKK